MIAKRKHGQRQLHRAKVKARYYTACFILCLVEALVSAVPTALFATIIIPAVTRWRGGLGFGGEYLFLAAMFLITFTVIHNKVCDALFREEGQDQ